MIVLKLYNVFNCKKNDKKKKEKKTWSIILRDLIWPFSEFNSVSDEPASLIFFFCSGQELKWKSSIWWNPVCIAGSDKFSLLDGTQTLKVMTMRADLFRNRIMDFYYGSYHKRNTHKKARKRTLKGFLARRKFLTKFILFARVVDDYSDDTMCVVCLDVPHANLMSLSRHILSCFVSASKFLVKFSRKFLWLWSRLRERFWRLTPKDLALFLAACAFQNFLKWILFLN